MFGEQQHRQIGAVAALGERARGALYDYVASQGGPVSRDQAARAVGIGRPLAAFHLDRLVQAGLLEASYRRLGERDGPGAGRPSKLYRRSGAEVSVTLPPRDYELAARLLARAVAAGEASQRALDGVAEDLGVSLGRELLDRCGAGAATVPQGALLDLLVERGYEPFVAGGTLRLRNCPFHALAAEHPGMVCRMNLALLGGLARGAGPGGGIEARLDPAAGLCCVALHGGR